jgi:Na+-transporting methylmalonyl-CoA/oxaloacetate decarboxylase gamma subunit
MSNMVTALEITALGMGLVFGAIILLWWVMDLLTWVTAEKEPASTEEPVTDAHAAAAMECEVRAKAAAVAVAVAMAQQQASLAHPLCEPPTPIVSAWQLGTRSRQLYEKGTSIVRKPRKIG